MDEPVNNPNWLSMNPSLKHKIRKVVNCHFADLISDRHLELAAQGLHRGVLTIENGVFVFVY